MSKKYQILVEAIIAQNEEQKKSFETSLSSQVFKDLTLNIYKVKLSPEAITNLQTQIKNAFKDIGFDLDAQKAEQAGEKAGKNISKGMKKIVVQSAGEVASALKTQFSNVEDIQEYFTGLGYDKVSVGKTFDVDGIKKYNVELTKVRDGWQTVDKAVVSVNKDNEHTIESMKSVSKEMSVVADSTKNVATQGKSSNEILNEVTASAGQAAQKFSALQSLISQGYKVTSTTEKFGIDAEGNSVLEGYNVQLERVNGNLKEIATGYVGVDEEGGEFLKGIKATGKEVTDVSSKVANYSETLNQLKSHHAEAFKNKDVQRYAQDLENTISAFGKGTKTVDDVSLSTKKLTGEIRTVEKGFRTATTATNDFSSGLKTAINKIIMWGIGTSVVYGALRNFKEAIQYIRDLNKELINIQVVTGQNATSIKALAKEYNNLAAEMGSTTIEVARGALTFIRQGKSAEESATLLKNSLMMAKLAAMETSEASDYLTSIMNGFQLSVGETTSAVDKLVAVDNAAATSVAELAEALSRSSSVAQQAGVSYENLVAYAGTISSVTRRSAESIGEALPILWSGHYGIKI